VTIERLVDALNEYGVRREAWTLIRTVKAQIIQASAEDFLSSAGVPAVSVMIFRVRFVDGITPADHRIIFNRHEHDVKEIKEIGRRRGLEIRATSRKLEP
jgi:head-tail adaptor